MDILFRRAVRGILLDELERVLLIRTREPASGRIFWHVPGGGYEPPETPRAALGRELLEELGLAQAEIGELLWEHPCTFMWKDREIRQHEEFYHVRCTSFTPRRHLIPTAEESEAILDYRWFAVTELPMWDEPIFPKDLAQRLCAPR